MKLLIATKNPGKAREIREFLGKDFKPVTLADLPDVEETGKTFEENSLLKAKKYFEWFYAQQGSSLYNKDDPCIGCIADDGGLEIDFLKGEPGVKSRRWPGYEATDQELIDIAIEKLKEVPWEKRTAHLRTVGTFYDGRNILTETAAVDGYIVEEAPSYCEKGYPFRSIFWIPKFNKLYQDLTDKEHQEVNHRRTVYSKLGHSILRWFQNSISAAISDF